MVKHDTCLTCKIARQQKWRETLGDHKKVVDEQRTSLQFPKAAKLTPLFWNAARCKFDDIWIDQDPTSSTASGASQTLLQSLICHRESRFKEMWKKQA